MVALPSIHGPAALGLLALATLLHEIGVPLPIAPVGLFLAARGIDDGTDFLVFTVTMIFLTLLANFAWFVAGRRRGAAVLNVLRRFSLAADAHVTRAERHFVRWGPWTLVLGHFLPGLTLVAPPLAGALGMKTSRFLVLTSIGAALYSLPLLVGGFLLRNRIEAVLETLDRVHTHLVAGLACLVAGYVVWRWVATRRRANRGTAA